MLKEICACVERLHLTPNTAEVIVKRFLPARGTKSSPRYLWDEEDLKKKANGVYTHKPLVVRRLGGRHPETGYLSNTHFLINTTV